MTKQKIFILILAVLFILVASIYLLHSPKPKTTTQVAQTKQTASSTGSDLYTMSQAERDNFLFTMNEDKNYRVAVNATDDGIQNHRDLVWDDIDFWNHRGTALYELGDCADAGAAFYHVLVRDPNDDVASAFMIKISSSNKKCKTATSTSSTK